MPHIKGNEKDVMISVVCLDVENHVENVGDVENVDDVENYVKMPGLEPCEETEMESNTIAPPFSSRRQVT